MADTTARTRRRSLFVLAHGLLLALLLGLLADDLAWTGTLLTRLAETLTGPLGASEPTVWAAALIVAVPASLIAGLALWISPRTGLGFGLWTIAALAVLTFPYARLPWTRMLGGPVGDVQAPPAGVWLLAGALVALATIETSVCARERVADELHARRLIDPEQSAPSSLAWAHRFGLAGALLAAGVLLTLFAALHPHLGTLAGNLDLLWVPALAGLGAGVALWLWAK